MRLPLSHKKVVLTSDDIDHVMAPSSRLTVNLLPTDQNTSSFIVTNFSPRSSTCPRRQSNRHREEINFPRIFQTIDTLATLHVDLPSAGKIRRKKGDNGCSGLCKRRNLLIVTDVVGCKFALAAERGVGKDSGGVGAGVGNSP